MSRLFSSACSGAMYSKVPTICPTSVNMVRSVSFLPGGLGNAKVDHLWNRLAIVQAHDHVRRLQVAVNDPLLVRMLHRLADGNEQFQPLPQRELLLVAILGDRDASDELHDEEGSARGRGTRVEHLGDVRMIHQGERLALLFKAGDDLLGIHPGLDDLERHYRLTGLLLFGQEHGAHAPLAQLLQQLVRAELVAGTLGRPQVSRGRPLRRHRQAGRGPEQETAGTFVGVQKLLDTPPQRLVSRTGLLQKRGPRLGRGLLQGLQKNVIFVHGIFCHGEWHL